jgi:hypothetical protein
MKPNETPRTILPAHGAHLRAHIAVSGAGPTDATSDAKAEPLNRCWLRGHFALLSFLAVLLALSAVAVSAADFFVAPDGKDINPGTAAAPFATVTRAREAVRQEVREGLTKDILVLIRGGVYAQTQTLTFGCILTTSLRLRYRGLRFLDRQ